MAETAPELDESLTLADAARILRVHVDTMRHRVRDGTLPHFRAAGKIRIRAQDFQQFLLREQKPRPRRTIHQATTA